ncbi:MAG: pirin family protein [Nitrososphaeria archaeon]
MGNRGVVGPGELQWVTAGSGIFHQEMPGQVGRSDGAHILRSRGAVKGFQLWINLPSRMKMINPVYRSIRSRSVPVVEIDGGILTSSPP